MPTTTLLNILAVTAGEIKILNQTKLIGFYGGNANQTKCLYFLLFANIFEHIQLVFVYTAENENGTSFFVSWCFTLCYLYIDIKKQR